MSEPLMYNENDSDRNGWAGAVRKTGRLTWNTWVKGDTGKLPLFGISSKRPHYVSILTSP